MAEMPVTSGSKAMVWVGRVLSALPVLMLLMAGVMSFNPTQEMADNMTAMGWSPSLSPVIGTLAVCCAIVYAIPQTAVLGAILLTGYLGGAVATHLRAGENAKCAIPVIFGIVVWLGLLLRDARLRDLLPLRRL